MNLAKPFYKKTVSYKHDRTTLRFQVSQELFSSQSVDHGTQRLLRTLLYEKVEFYKKALDLGCGYGPIGIALKAMCSAAEVHLVDRDALALEYSRINADLNKVGPVKVYGSLGYDSVADRDFDLIVSNIPAKAGEPVLRHMIKGAQSHVVKNGRVVIVVIDAIADFIHQELTTDDTIEILFHRSWPGHHVYHYRFRSKQDRELAPDEEGFDAGTFYRQEHEFSYRGQRYRLAVSYDLPEFDQLSYGTQLLLANIGKITGKPDKLLCFNPGQGHIPIALAKEFSPTSIYLVDRDLLALNTAHQNLLRQGFSGKNIKTKHQVGFAVGVNNFDAAVGPVPEKQNPDVYKMLLKQIENQLRPGAYALLGSSSTVITRLQELHSQRKTFEVLFRDRDKGRSVLLLKKQ